MKQNLKKICRDPGSNRGPLDLQSNALPTELSRLLVLSYLIFKIFFQIVIILALRNFPVRNNPERNIPERKNPKHT